MVVLDDWDDVVSVSSGVQRAPNIQSKIRQVSDAYFA
jgi:hypothetical protein